MKFISRLLFLIVAIFALFAFFGNLKENYTFADCPVNISTTANKSQVAAGDQISFTTTISTSCSPGQVNVKFDPGPDVNLGPPYNLGGFSDNGDGTYSAFGFPSPGGDLSWTWAAYVQSTCGSGVNAITARAVEFHTGNTTPTVTVPVFAFIGITFQNNTGINQNVTTRVFNRFGNVVPNSTQNFSVSPGASNGPVNSPNVRCDEGPFIVQWNNGGPWRTDLVGPQNFNVTNGCNTQVFITYSGEPPPGVPTPTPTPPPPPPGVNLVPTSFTISPTTVAPGANITATVTVTNNGGAGAGSFQVAWTRSGIPPDCSSSTETRTVASLAAGASTTITFNPFAAPTTPGSYTAGVFVDCGSAVSETNESDNTATAPYTVSSGPTPAPVPGDFSVSLTPADITIAPGGTAVYTGTVSTGSGFSGTVNVAYFWTCLDCNGSPATYAVTLTYPASDSRSFTMTTTPAIVPGTYTITMRGENSGNNRTDDSTLTVTSGATPPPTPISTPTPPPPPPPPPPGRGLTLTIDDKSPERLLGSSDSTVYNFSASGDCPNPHTLSYRINHVPSGSEPTINVTLSPSTITPGGSGTVTVSTSSTPDDRYKLDILVSAACDWARGDSATFVVGSVPWWTDLQVQACVGNNADLKIVYSVPTALNSGNIRLFKDGVWINPPRGDNVAGNGVLVKSSQSNGVYQGDLYVGNFYVMSDVAVIACGLPPPPTPPPLPPPPTWPADANLQAVVSCVGGQPEISFSWNDATGEDRYFLDVNGAAWTGLGSPSPWGVKSRLANKITFTWSAASPMDSGDVDPVTAGEQRAPVNNKTYWWRVFAENTGGGSHRYAPNSATWPGVSLPPPNCVAPEVDLKARFVNDPTSPSPVGPYQPNQAVTIKVRVTNIGTLASGATTVGFWPQGSTIACPNPAPPPPVQSVSVLGLAPVGSVDVSITFNTPSTAGTYIANAFVIPNCNNGGPANLDDVFWPNNKTDGLLKAGDSDGPGVFPGGFIYTVKPPASWFETIGGDVGARNGAISVSQTPIPAGRYQSGYLAVAAGDLANIVTRGGWRIKNYTGGLVSSGGIYTYLAERFRQKAIDEGHDASHISGTCLINAGAIPNNKKFAYCSGHAEFDVGSGPIGQQVWFIDGNLTIKRDLELAATDTITFIVKGNIIIETGVARADGLYITDGIFADTDPGGGKTGVTLRIYGAVYGGNVNLTRVLASGNDLNPAEQIIFDPKYLISLNTLLGSPSFSWREVAP